MILGAQPYRSRVQLVVLAGAVAAVVWDLQGDLEVALAASALVLQLIELMRVEPLP